MLFVSCVQTGVAEPNELAWQPFPKDVQVQKGLHLSRVVFVFSTRSKLPVFFLLCLVF